MWLVYTIIVVYILFKFNKSLTKTTDLANKSVDIADDKINTMANNIFVDNAKQRLKQKARIEEMGEVVTQKDIENLLAKKRAKSASKTTEPASA